MRAQLLTMATLALALAGCGDAGTGGKAAKAAAAGLAAGQWELVSEVSGFDKLDGGAPRINSPVGTRTTQSICVSAEARPPVAFFAGEGNDCSYGSYYVRNGRANVTLNCRRAGMPGTIEVSAEGTFEAGSAQLNRTLQTTLVSDGDVRIESRVTARRTGECAGEGETR